MPYPLSYEHPRNYPPALAHGDASRGSRLRFRWSRDLGLPGGDRPVRRTRPRGRLLFRARQSRNLTTEQLAHRLGWSAWNAYRLETGSVGPRE
jgi:hypothetical protein